MAKRMFKGGLLAAVFGSMLSWGGCLNLDGWWGNLITSAATYGAMEYVLDNDTVFDLFEDGNVQ